MVNFCAIVGCSNRADRDKSNSFGEWLARIKREDLPPENYPYTRVCSDHFVSGKPSQLYEINHEDWAPSQNLYQANMGIPAFTRGKTQLTTRRIANVRIHVKRLMETFIKSIRS